IKDLDAAAAYERFELLEQLAARAHVPFTPESERPRHRAFRTLDRVFDQDGAWAGSPGSQDLGKSSLQGLRVAIARPLQNQTARLLLTHLVELGEALRG